MHSINHSAKSKMQYVCQIEKTERESLEEPTVFCKKQAFFAKNLAKTAEKQRLLQQPSLRVPSPEKRRKLAPQAPHRQKPVIHV